MCSCLSGVLLLYIVSSLRGLHPGEVRRRRRPRPGPPRPATHRPLPLTGPVKARNLIAPLRSPSMWAPRRRFRPPWGDVSENKRFTYQPALDGLRAFAVLSVFAYHLDAGWARGGFLGVDTFFVLSGFLITSLLVGEWARHGGISFAGFWARRARRLLPALLLVLLAVAAFAVLEAPADQLDGLRGDGLATLFYGANWRFIASGQSYFNLFTEASPLRHMWSLAIEEQFYLVWPLITFVCLRLARGRHWLLGLVCGAGAGASVATMAVLYDPSDPSRAYYGTDSRAHLLLIGAGLALILARWAPGRGGA